MALGLVFIAGLLALDGSFIDLLLLETFPFTWPEFMAPTSTNNGGRETLKTPPKICIRLSQGCCSLFFFSPNTSGVFRIIPFCYSHFVPCGTKNVDQRI